MPCLKPIPAHKYPSGAVTIKHRRSPYAFGCEIELPCGSCQACRTVRIRDWAIRGYHESLTNLRSTPTVPILNGCFVTLTYDAKNYAKLEAGSLKLADWQNFMKKMRRDLPGPIRYLACGEYGPIGGRAHMHACLYGVDFHEDRTICETSTSKETSVEWLSPTLTTIWGRGFATLGPLTYATASYTAGYVLKKLDRATHASESVLYGDQAEPLLDLKREFNTMSKNPGLGSDWFDKYWPDVYPADEVVINGNTFRPPAYYDTLLKRRDPALHADVIAQRTKFIDKRGLTSDHELRARGAIFAARAKITETQRGEL